MANIITPTLSTSAVWLFICFEATAGQFLEQTYVEQADNYEINLTYEILGKDVVPNWDTINQQFANSIKSNGCDAAKAAGSSVGFYYDAASKIEEVTPGYVTFRIHYSVYCGGARPSHGIDFRVFDVVTGDEIEISKEVPVQNYDAEGFDQHAYEVFQHDLANMILDHLKPNSDVRVTCPDALADPGSIVTTFSPRIAALGTNGSAIILTYPPHVISVCQFYVSVPFEKVRKHFAKGSIVHERMD